MLSPNFYTKVFSLNYSNIGVCFSAARTANASLQKIQPENPITAQSKSRVPMWLFWEPLNVPIWETKIILKTFSPVTEPPDPRRVSEGFLKGSLKGSLKGFWRFLKGSAEEPFKTPSKPLQEPFETSSRRRRTRWCVRLPGALKSVPRSGVL